MHCVKVTMDVSWGGYQRYQSCEGQRLLTLVPGRKHDGYWVQVPIYEPKVKLCLSMTRFKKSHCCPTRPTYTNVKWKTEGCTATAQTSPKLRHHTRQCIAWTLRSGHGRHIWATIKIFYTLKAMSQITRSKPPWCTYMHDFMTEAKPCPHNGSRYFAYFYIKDRGMEIPCHL